MKKYLVLFASSLVALSASLTSCSDFFDVESDHIIYADQDHLHNTNDRMYSVTGILNKLQSIADRTILLGEARGELMNVTSATPADLRSIATFTVDDDNIYNVPSDYYAVINNCNYFIAKADTALKNNRNEYLFKDEYAAVKAIRAWTYLQLVTTYGKVPFVTTPVLSKDEAERDYPMYGIQEVCNYFINEDGLQDLIGEEYPDYGEIKRLDSRLFFFPMYLVLGDLNLWAGNYLQAAKCYYGYLSTRNGDDSYYPTGLDAVMWDDAEWAGLSTSLVSYSEVMSDESEMITIIPGDSIPSEGNYSGLRNVFNSTSENNYSASLVPSAYLKDLSGSQVYCHYDGRNREVIYAPLNLEENMGGDLRLSNFWYTSQNAHLSTGERIDSYQQIYKYATGNVHIYRRQLVYLRLAEALNCAGYPLYAYCILATGVDEDIVNNLIIPYYNNEADSLVISQFPFPRSQYKVYGISTGSSTVSNTQGIHSRGSGYSMVNEFYSMPFSPTAEDMAAQTAYQQKAVEDMIVDEEALEFAFEGYRYYDLLRVALRREATEPDFLEKHIQARNGVGESGVQPGLLLDKKNWFLHWNGKIGY